jgi:hypothetical protein
MIKATGTRGNGKPFVLVGITGENVTRIVAGEPLKINLGDVGLDDIEIAVVYGKTEAELVAQIEPFTGPETKRRHD